MRQGLLALLDQADMYGYQLRSEFEVHTGGVWPLNIGQVYATLERLERDGLVALAQPRDGAQTTTTSAGPAASAGGREQKYYAITRAGRDELQAWFAATPGDEPPPRDELIAKVLLALAGGHDHAIDVITRQRSALTAALQGRRRALRAAHNEVTAPTSLSAGGVAAGGGAADERATGDDDLQRLAPLLVTDALVARAEADLRWLDMCDARLASRAVASNGTTTPTERTGGR